MDKKILNHFKNNDPLLHSVAIKIKGLEKLEKSKPQLYFLELCDVIISQQLSGAAAKTIFEKFKKLFSKGVTPEAVLRSPHEKLRWAGLSNAKAKYLKNLAQAIVDDKLQLSKLDSLLDEEIKKQLIQIKGIGPWSAEMFLMFTLVRPDVFSYGDLGLRKGIMKIYGFKKDPSVKTVERIVNKWSPYKTYAARILWLSLDLD